MITYECQSITGTKLDEFHLSDIPVQDERDRLEAWKEALKAKHGDDLIEFRVYMD